MYRQNLYKKYNKIKEMLRETYYKNKNTNGYDNSYNLPYSTPSNSPILKYSIPLYETYVDETNEEIVFKSKKSVINETNSQYINNNKILVEIIILSYLFSSTLIMSFIKYMFN